MKALVTGITGFAGNYLAKLLIEKDLDVYGISQEDEFKPFLTLDRSLIRYYAANITDKLRIEEILSNIGPDLIFHLAAKSSPSKSTKCPEETFETNFGGTLAILEAIRVHKIHCRFLLVSSSHVYGDNSADNPVPENAPLRPESPYAASKAAAEMLTYQYWKAYGIAAVIVRAFNHTGPGQGPGFVCPDLARKVVEIERGLRPSSLKVSDLKRQIDFSDVRDIVRGYYSALSNGALGEVYNLCSGKGITIQSVVEKLAAGVQKPIEIKPYPQGAGVKTKAGIIGDNSRAVRDLGWKPAIPFADTVREILEYWRQAYSNPPLPTEDVKLQE